MKAVLTWNNVDDVDWCYSAKNGEHIWNTWEEDGDNADDALESGCADNVKLLGEIFLSSHQVVQSISEGDVV